MGARIAAVIACGTGCGTLSVRRSESARAYARAHSRSSLRQGQAHDVVIDVNNNKQHQMCVAVLCPIPAHTSQSELAKQHREHDRRPEAARELLWPRHSEAGRMKMWWVWGDVVTFDVCPRCGVHWCP